MTGHGVGVEDPARDQLESEGLAADDDRVARVVATLITDDEPHVPGEKVGQLPLALVAPLGSDHDGRGHQFVLPSGSTALILLAGASHPGMRKIQRFS